MSTSQNVIDFLLKEIEKKDIIIDNMNKRREEFCKEYIKRREESNKKRDDHLENMRKRHIEFNKEYEIVKKRKL